MVGDPGFDDMVDACIDAGAKVMRSGTPHMQNVMRVFLIALGKEIGRRSREEGLDLSDTDAIQALLQSSKRKH